MNPTDSFGTGQHEIDERGQHFEFPISCSSSFDSIAVPLFPHSPETVQTQMSSPCWLVRVERTRPGTSSADNVMVECPDSGHET